MRIRFFIAGLIIFALCGATSPAQDLRANPDTRKTSILVFKDGYWKRVKELKRNGPMFEFYEKYGRNLSRERYVSIPADRVDVDAVVDVNNALLKLKSVCSKGKGANFEIDLEGRARVIFIEMATSAVYVEDDRKEIGGCFNETPMWKDIRTRTAAAATPIPSSTPTPTPTRAPTPRPGDIVCNVFEGLVAVSGERLQISLATDLPDDTDLMVGVSRTYRAKSWEGEQDYGATYLSENSTVGEWKKTHSVDVSSEKLNQILDQEVKRIQGIGIQYDIVAGGISKDIEVRFLVPENQSNSAFGKSNENLVGQMVRQKGKARLIQWERSIHLAPPRPLKYQVVKTESYTASVAGRFESGSKVHVVTREWDRVEDIAKEIARRKYRRAVTVYFWNRAGEVGGLEGAVFGVELMNGKVEEILVDRR